MPFIRVPGVAQVNIRADYLGVPMENVLCFTTGEDPATPQVLQQLTEGMSASWNTNMLPHLSSAYVLREYHTRDLSVENGSVWTDATAAGNTGVQAGAPLPGNIAFCISFRTGLAGRSHRGRIYIAGLTEPEVTGNLLAQLRVDGLVDGLNAVRADMFTLGFVHVIASRFHNNAPRAVGISTNVIATVAVDNRVDTQRGRLS